MSASARFRLISTMIAIALVILTSFVARAEFTNAKCSKVLTASGDVMIQRDWDENSRSCFISLHPMDVTNLEYRDYYFDNFGLFLVFNSFGEGPISETTGARGFMLFPQIYEYPDFSIEENADVIVRMVSGHTIRIDGKKFSVKEFSPGKFIEKDLSKTNNGGLEIFPSRGFWFDQDFKMGSMNYENKKLKTKIFGSLGGVCSVINSMLYDYSVDHVQTLYSKNELNDFISSTCPSVKY